MGHSTASLSRRSAVQQQQRGHIVVVASWVLVSLVVQHTGAAAPAPPASPAPPVTASTTDATTARGAVVEVLGPTEQPVVLQHFINSSVVGLRFINTANVFELVKDAWMYISDATPVVLGRNFSITSGLPPPGTVLSLGQLDGKVALTPGSTFDFADLTVVHARWACVRVCMCGCFGKWVADGSASKAGCCHQHTLHPARVSPLLVCARRIPRPPTTATCRKLNPVSLDIIKNSPGARVRLTDVLLVDAVCAARNATQDLAQFRSLPDLPGFPRNRVSAAPTTCARLPAEAAPGQQPQLEPQPRCFDGGVHVHSLAVVLALEQRAAVTDPAAAAAAAASGDAFIYVYQNVIRVCMGYLDPACLEQHAGDADLCWELAAQGASGGGNWQRGPALQAGAVAGIAIGGEERRAGRTDGHLSLWT